MSGSRLRWTEYQDGPHPEYRAADHLGRLYCVECVPNYDRDGIEEWVATIDCRLLCAWDTVQAAMRYCEGEAEAARRGYLSNLNVRTLE